MGEPYSGVGVNQVTFTLNVAPSPAPVAPPSSQWYIIWNRRSIAADGSDRRFVAMKTDAAGTPTFVYGDFGPPLPLDGSIPPVNANTPTPLGSADVGSFDPLTGVITIKLSTNKMDATPLVAGNDLAGLNVRTYLARPDAGQKSQNNAADITANGSYTLVGNAACFCTVDQPPVASMTATPTEGAVPLAVSFNATGSSDPDVGAGDGIATYTFNFGDGSAPVTQGSPTISHTYTTASGPSGYFATLTVTDSKCTQPSVNIASLNIQAHSGPAGVDDPSPRPATFQVRALQNPSRDVIRMSLGLDRSERVHVGVFNATGRRVAELMDEQMPAGNHDLTWQGTDPSGRRAPAGVYMVRVTAGTRVSVTRVMLIH